MHKPEQVVEGDNPIGIPADRPLISNDEELEFQILPNGDFADEQS